MTGTDTEFGMHPHHAETTAFDLLQTEVDMAYLYATLASLEESPNMAHLYHRLADIEKTLAEAQCDDTSLPPPSMRARIVERVARQRGKDILMIALTALESRLLEY